MFLFLAAVSHIRGFYSYDVLLLSPHGTRNILAHN